MNTLPKERRIRPFNSDMEIRVRSLICLNELHGLGFIRPQMMHDLLVGKNVLKEDEKTLSQRFWNLNYHDIDFISAVENVIANVKQELKD